MCSSQGGKASEGGSSAATLAACFCFRHIQDHNGGLNIPIFSGLLGRFCCCHWCGFWTVDSALSSLNLLRQFDNSFLNGRTAGSTANVPEYPFSNQNSILDLLWKFILLVIAEDILNPIFLSGDIVPGVWSLLPLENLCICRLKFGLFSQMMFFCLPVVFLVLSYDLMS